MVAQFATLEAENATLKLKLQAQAEANAENFRKAAALAAKITTNHCPLCEVHTREVVELKAKCAGLEGQLGRVKAWRERVSRDGVNAKLWEAVDALISTAPEPLFVVDGYWFSGADNEVGRRYESLRLAPWMDQFNGQERTELEAESQPVTVMGFAKAGG